jgi:GntR family transcriptional regulator
MDLNNAQPLYAKVLRQLDMEIAQGSARPGDRLPGERTLCKHFQVSRVTMRRALAELRDRGVIEADGTRGWFVAATAVGEPNALMSFSEMARSRGLSPSSRVLRAEVRPATIDEGEALRVAPGAEIFDLERVRLLDGVSVAIEHSRVPLQLAPSLAAANLAAGSLYEALRRDGAGPASADYVLQAIAADARQAALLEVKGGAPLLMATAVSHDGRGRPIELSCSIFRGDRYRFRTTLQRPKSNEVHAMPVDQPRQAGSDAKGRRPRLA